MAYSKPGSACSRVSREFVGIKAATTKSTRVVLVGFEDPSESSVDSNAYFPLSV